jgi:hypothetical protein
MIKYFYLILLFTGFLNRVYAQETVSGFIKDEAGQSIPGATIVLKGTSKYTSSDLDGKFSIAAPKELPFTLHISLTGYQDQEVEIYELSAEPAEISLKTANVPLV